MNVRSQWSVSCQFKVNRMQAQISKIMIRMMSFLRSIDFVFDKPVEAIAIEIGSSSLEFDFILI